MRNFGFSSKHAIAFVIQAAGTRGLSSVASSA
jgi:hypothetical protein